MFLVQTGRRRWPYSISSCVLVNLRIALVGPIRLLILHGFLFNLSLSLYLLRFLSNFGCLRSSIASKFLSLTVLISEFYLLRIKTDDTSTNLWVNFSRIMNCLTDVFSIIVHHNHVIVIIGLLVFLSLFRLKHCFSFDILHIFIKLFALHILV